MSAMQDTDAIRRELLAQREALRTRLAALLHAADDPAERALAGRSGPGDDGASADLLAGTSVARYEHEQESLRAIEQALEALEDGSYGTCHACGADIPAARLSAQPASALCRSCQEQAERRAGLHVPSL